MTSPRPLNTALAATVVLCMALPTHGQDFLLYTPQPVTSSAPNISQEGVLVQEIEIKKGDTLSGISRRYNGRGKYYPQILLFNSIKNPNLIYAGQTLRVPVSHTEASGVERSVTKPAGIRIRADKKTSPQAAPKTIAVLPPPAERKSAAVPPPAAVESSGQKLFETAVTAYRKDDCQTALELLDRFLAENAGSLLAADANLYKAECFLKLSAH